MAKEFFITNKLVIFIKEIGLTIYMMVKELKFFKKGLWATKVILWKEKKLEKVN